MFPTTSTRRSRRFALRACLTASLAASLTACSGGAGNGPALRRADATPLVSLATRIQHEDACAQRGDIRKLLERTKSLVNARRVPAQLQEPLMSGVNALAEDSPPCVPAVPVQPTTTYAPPPVRHPPKHPKPPHHHGHGHDKHHGHDD